MSLSFKETNCPDITATQFCSGYVAFSVNKDGTVEEHFNADDGDVVKVKAYGRDFVMDGGDGENKLVEFLKSKGWKDEYVNNLLVGLGVWDEE